MIARIIISRSDKQLVETITKLLIEVGTNRPHPDLLYFPSGSKLGIAEARKIKDHFSTKPYSAKGKTIVLEDASKLTDEAQNSLLKTLEEPPPDAMIILGAASDANFLPTILSRCEVIYLPDSNPAGHRFPTYEVYIKDLEKLLESSLEQRFEYIEKCKEREEFLRFLIQYFHQQLTKNHTIAYENVNGSGLREFLKKLLQAEEWNQANVNIRAILEYLMLVMPQKL